MKLSSGLKIGLLLVVGCLCLGTSSSFAVDEPGTPTQKLGRGLANTVLGPLEVPNQIYQTWHKEKGRSVETKSDAFVKATFTGTVTGFREAFRRVGHGVWDTATFLSPGPGGNQYKTRYSPEYIRYDYDY
jgi:putative exosortase-associated protein (TIGR04073 family)